MKKLIFDYYRREDVQEMLIREAKNREIAYMFLDGSFSSRPLCMEYKNDIIAMVKNGAIEFHCSIERWRNVKAIGIEDDKENRIGWDILIDIDCNATEIGKVASHVICKTIEKNGIENYSIKFTGGSGFHIAIPFETFPEKIDYKHVKELYPELAKRVIEYIKIHSKPNMEKMFLKHFDIDFLVDKAKVKNIFEDNVLNPYTIVELDPVLISPRHLFRMPYSINRNTMLVSIPIKPHKILSFEKSLADPNIVDVELPFLSKGGKRNEAEILFMRAIENVSIKKERKNKGVIIKNHKTVHKKYFPPCINEISSGLKDGRKRSVLILINFLKNMNYSWDEIEKFIIEWNERNSPPLRKSYINSQLKYNKRRDNKIPPPNCNVPGWYKDFNVCKPDNVCSTIKNPITYPFRKMKIVKKRR